MELHIKKTNFKFENVSSFTWLSFDSGIYIPKKHAYILENVIVQQIRECKVDVYAQTKRFDCGKIVILRDCPELYYILQNEAPKPTISGLGIGEFETDADIFDNKFFEDFAKALFEIKKQKYIKDALSFIVQDYYAMEESQLITKNTEGYDPIYIAALTEEDFAKLDIKTC